VSEVIACVTTKLRPSKAPAGFSPGAPLGLALVSFTNSTPRYTESRSP